MLLFSFNDDNNKCRFLANYRFIIPNINALKYCFEKYWSKINVPN